MTDIAALTGIDPIRLLGHGHSGHIVALGAEYVAHGDDWCELVLPYDRRLISDLATGILASGPIVSIMDTAGRISICLKRGLVEEHATLDLRIDYLRPARPGLRVYGRCHCYRLTRRVGFVDGTAHDGDPEDPIARVSASFLLDTVPVA